MKTKETPLRCFNSTEERKHTMILVTRNEELEANFHRISDYLAHTDPDDFDSQIPPIFISCDAAQKTVLCSFEVKRFFGNPHGFMHGGLSAAMLDTAQGTSIHAFCGVDTHIVTISLHTSYIRPVVVGKPLYVRVHVQQIGGRIAYTFAEAWQEEGEIAVTANGVYHLIHGTGIRSEKDRQTQQELSQ